MNLFKLVFILIFATSLQSLAADKKTSAVKTKTNVKQENGSKKKIGVDQSDFMPGANSFGLVTSYSVVYNDLQQVDQKTYRHRVSFTGTYSFDKHWSSYASLGATHQSYGNNIVRDNDNDDFHEISNLNLGAVYTKMKPLSFVQRSSNTVNVGLPVSRRSRVDKHIANVSLTNFMQSYSWKGFFLFNRFSGNYLWNTQRFTIFDDGAFFRGDRLNRDWLLSDSFGVTYMVLPRVGVRGSYRLDMVRTLDGRWAQSFGSNISTFANVWGCMFFASMINNSYVENERLDLGYYDKYRRVFLGGLTYVF